MANIVLRESALRIAQADAQHSVRLSEVELDSGGVSNEEQGNRMDRRAIKVLSDFGYDVSDPLIANHRAKKISQQDVLDAKIILAMTDNHVNRIIREFNAKPSKVYMWRWFEQFATVDSAKFAANGQTGPFYGDDLADPWYGDESDFRLALEQLEKSSDMIIRFAI